MKERNASSLISAVAYSHPTKFAQHTLCDVPLRRNERRLNSEKSQPSIGAFAIVAETLAKPELEREAAHVAGHALGAVLLGTRASVRSWGGFCIDADPLRDDFYEEYGWFKKITAEIIRDVVLPCFLAGLAAERLISGDLSRTPVNGRCTVDMNMATELICILFKQERDAGEPTVPESSEQFNAFGNSVALDAQMKALRLLGQNAPRLMRLKGALMEKKSLTHEEVEAIIA